LIKYSDVPFASADNGTLQLTPAADTQLQLLTNVEQTILMRILMMLMRPDLSATRLSKNNPSTNPFISVPQDCNYVKELVAWLKFGHPSTITSSTTRIMHHPNYLLKLEFKFEATVDGVVHSCQLAD
jgi:hypothetical protein